MSNANKDIQAIIDLGRMVSHGKKVAKAVGKVPEKRGVVGCVTENTGFYARGGAGKGSYETHGEGRFKAGNGKSKFDKPAGPKSLGGHTIAMCQDMIYSGRLNGRDLDQFINNRQPKISPRNKTRQGQGVVESMDMAFYYNRKHAGRKNKSKERPLIKSRGVIAWEKPE